ncbi:MAG: YigZ family protein [Spirochaetia bacterium]|nr:YigZ family protein [Spirochaetia bacterium]MBR0319115.1 YigZ family protein [Spirochaetia bacterium]
MEESLLIPAGESLSELVEKHSRFIAQCFYISDEKEAKEIVKRLWELHPGARHIVWAFVIGEKNSRTMGMSDDGEPKGTAGRPVLNVLSGSGITNVLCTVVRYFGGTLLGTGGLVKAYSQSAKDAIEKLPTKPLVKETTFSFRISYDTYDLVKYLLRKFEVQIIDENFSEDIKIKAVAKESLFESIENEILQLTAGKAKIEK